MKLVSVWFCERERKKDNLTLATKTDQLKVTVILNTLNLFLKLFNHLWSRDTRAPVSSSPLVNSEATKFSTESCTLTENLTLKVDCCVSVSLWMQKNEDSVISVNKSLPSFQVFDTWCFVFHSLNTLRKEPIYEEPHNTGVYITNIYHLLNLRWYDFLHRHGEARCMNHDVPSEVSKYIRHFPSSRPAKPEIHRLVFSSELLAEIEERGAQGQMWAWCVSVAATALWLLHSEIWISVTDNVLFTLPIFYKVATFLFPVFVTQPTLATNSHFIHPCDRSVCWCSC